MASKILFNGYSIIPLLNNGKKSFAVAIAITGNSSGALAINYLGINNGNIFSTSGTVSLDSSCTGNPTHYMASRLSTFADTDWQPYSSQVFFELWQVGVNRIYFKVKNATEVTDMVWREIGWHGQEAVTLTDTVYIGNVSVSETIVVSKPTILSSDTLADEVVVGSVSVSDDIVVKKNNVQVYP